jgi:hypothetical protein
MCCAPPEYRFRARVLAGVTAALVVVAMPACALDRPPADEIVQRADEHRGVPGPHEFLARIVPAKDDPVAADAHGGMNAMLVRVRANGFAQQLVFVLAPTRGDVMLATPDVVWLRPRRLHRLTRIPPDLRMLGAASISDVTSVDMAGSYVASVRPALEDRSDVWTLELTAGRTGVRYPRARYQVRRDDCRPLRIEFMAASGKVLKTIAFAGFEAILGRVIPTSLIVQDLIHRDRSIVSLSEFHVLPPPEPGMFTPEYVLGLPDET